MMAVATKRELIGPKFNREALMSPLVSEWLKSMGYAVYSEVLVSHRPIDHVGVRWSDESIICVEMKTTCSYSVIDQARMCLYMTPLSYVAVPSMPQKASIEKLKKFGIGLLVNGIVVFEPGPKMPYYEVIDKYHLRVLSKCHRSLEGGVGGLPNLKGDGPAIRCSRLIREYLKEHPDAKWKDIWLNVPNHYAHARSMQGAMGHLIEAVKKQS